ncbi:hypothetical protein [Bradyrhizobium sp. USDA 4486]
MTIERPMFPPRAESVDSFYARPATGQPETEKRTSDSPKPIGRLSNVIDLSARREARALPSEKVRPVEFPVSGRQRAGRKMNPLRHPCNRVSSAVIVAGKLQRGEALRVDPYFDEGALLWKGVEAARLLVEELFELAVKHGGRPQQ